MHQAACLKDSKHTVGAHELGAVEQCQSFFALQLHRFPTEFVEHADGFATFPLVVDVTHADERQEEGGQWSEVARCTQGATVVDDGEDVVVEEVDDALYGDELHAAVSQ